MYLYIFKVNLEEDYFYKIGISSNPHQRLRVFTSNIKLNVEFVMARYTDNYMMVEGIIKDYYCDKTIYDNDCSGEFFNKEYYEKVLEVINKYTVETEYDCTRDNYNLFKKLPISSHSNIHFIVACYGDILQSEYNYPKLIDNFGRCVNEVINNLDGKERVIGNKFKTAFKDVIDEYHTSDIVNDKELITQIEEEYPEYVEFYKVLGYDAIKRTGYNIVVCRKMTKRDNINYSTELNFKVGDIVRASEVKQRLKEMYLRDGIETTAKATDISKWYDIKQMVTTRNGEKFGAYKIMGIK